MNFAILRAVFKKDLLSLWPTLALNALLFLGNAIITRLDLLPTLWPFTLPVLLLALVVLMLAVFQTDSPASLTDDWQCRPVPKRELLSAKLLLVIAVIYVPSFVGAFFSDLWLGFPVTASLLDAVLLRDELLLFLLPILMFTAIVTRTLVQGIAVLIGIFVVVFVVPTPFVREPGPLDPGVRDELFFSGIRWMSTFPAIVAAFLLVAVGFWLAYWRRKLMATRVLMAVTIAVALLLVLLPMDLIPWNSTFGLQKALGPTMSADTDRISLRHTRACFPATHRGELLTDASFVAAVHGGSAGKTPKLWEDEALQGVAAESVAFLTHIEPRGLPPDWRVNLNYVQAAYVVDGKKLYSLRPARYFNDRTTAGPLAHAWMLPSEAVQRLKDEPVELELTYSLTLMKPREHRLPTDGERHALPGLGYCRAVVDEAYNRIDVDCFGGVTSPAQISAELNEIPASRVYGGVDLAPAWVRWTYSRRAKLAISSPRLADHDSVTVTAWEVAGYLDRSLTLPGILGADLSTCPLPSTEGNGYQDVRWRDAAPHQARQINVDKGVQLEVLDFGGTGAPILLLPGLGATAHSFDELAPQWAKNHRVVAITRRGSGYSSKPDFGYDTPRLAQDVLQVMEAMQLEKPLLVGHSIAGEELTWLGGHYGDRFRGLVYLDAAYDRSQDGSQPSRLRELNATLPPEPPIPPAAFASYETLKPLLAQRGHLRPPEGELIAFRQVNNPALAGKPAIDGRAQQAIFAAIQAPDYRALKLPALAIFAFPDPNKPSPPWYDPNDATLAATRAEINRILDAKKRHDIETFRNHVEHGEVLELANAEHNIILSNPKEVLDAVERFDAKIR